MNQALAENKFAEILIRCRQYGIGVTAPGNGGSTMNAEFGVSQRLNTVASGTSGVNDPLIYIFVGDDIQQTFSKG